MIINKKELSCRGLRQLSVYIHIPFCVKKCNYCDFLSVPASGNEIESYSKALIAEIKEEAKRYKEYVVVTIFIGGGTPSLLSGEQLSEIIGCLKKQYNIIEDAEISIELNPGTVTKRKLCDYRKIGINRISIGLQSVRLEELKTLGRIHSYEQFLETYEAARSIGFDNINIDIMSALPEQTLPHYLETLEKVTALNPEHISAYSLIVEEGTPFYEKYKDGSCLPSEETDREMYEATKIILEKKGYFRYEISNYAKKGYECRHNLVYWTRENYVGFGIGAASMVENTRWKNTEEIEKYLECPKKENICELSQNEQIEEFMFLGLRVIDGISIQKFKELFLTDISVIYGNALEMLEKDNLIKKENGQIYLTQRGLDLSNYVFEKFLIN